MKEYKKYQSILFVANVCLVLMLYGFFEMKCFKECNIYIFKPLFATLLGLIPTTALLYFFSRETMLAWLKHIAWWYSLVILYVVGEINPYAGGVLSLDRGSVALFMMAILFVITLIYAPIMSHRLKKRVDA